MSNYTVVSEYLPQYQGGFQEEEEDDDDDDEEIELVNEKGAINMKYLQSKVGMKRGLST